MTQDFSEERKKNEEIFEFELVHVLGSQKRTVTLIASEHTHDDQFLTKSLISLKLVNRFFNISIDSCKHRHHLFHFVRMIIARKRK